MKRSGVERGVEHGPDSGASGSSSDEGDTTGRESGPIAASPSAVPPWEVAGGRGKRKGTRLKNRGTHSAPE